jgi:hypothetical protein
MGPLTALALVLCSAGAAQNVTVEVDGAPLGEVIAQLKFETEALITAQALPEEMLAQPLTYHAVDVPLKRALREICERMRAKLRTFQVGRGRPRYNLVPMPADETPPPTAQAGPYVVRLTAITHSRAVTRDFQHLDAPPRIQDELRLQMEAEADTDEDAEALLGLHPDAVVIDDTGRTLEPARREPSEPRMRGTGIFGQKLIRSITVAPPAEGATALTRVECELVAAEEVRPLRFELDAAQQGQGMTQDGYTVQLRAVAVRAGGRAEVALTVTPPPAGELRHPRIPDATCALLLEDGTEHRASAHTARGGTSENNIMRWEITYWARGLPEGGRPVKVVYSFRYRSQETRRIPFTFVELPLPRWVE